MAGAPHAGHAAESGGGGSAALRGHQLVCLPGHQLTCGAPRASPLPCPCRPTWAAMAAPPLLVPGKFRSTCSTCTYTPNLIVTLPAHISILTYQLNGPFYNGMCRDACCGEPVVSWPLPSRQRMIFWWDAGHRPPAAVGGGQSACNRRREHRSACAAGPARAGLAVGPRRAGACHPARRRHARDGDRRRQGAPACPQSSMHFSDTLRSTYAFSPVCSGRIARALIGFQRHAFAAPVCHGAGGGLTGCPVQVLFSTETPENEVSLCSAAIPAPLVLDAAAHPVATARIDLRSGTLEARLPFTHPCASQLKDIIIN